MQEEYIRPTDVARRLGVSRQAVYKWIKEGRLRAVRFGVGKGLRIPRSALEAFERDAVGRAGQEGYNLDDTQIGIPGRAASLESALA